MNLSSITYDLSASGGPERITFEELTRLAVRAKSKVKASKGGWSTVSQAEVLALAWFADLFLEDGAPPAPAPVNPKPEVISNV